MQRNNLWSRIPTVLTRVHSKELNVMNITYFQMEHGRALNLVPWTSAINQRHAPTPPQPRTARPPHHTVSPSPRYSPSISKPRAAKPWNTDTISGHFLFLSCFWWDYEIFGNVRLLLFPVGKRGRGFKCGSGTMKSICLPANYSKFELPHTEQVNNIGISIDIDEVLRINDGTYSITFSTYFNVEWKERRLNVTPEFGASLR